MALLTKHSHNKPSMCKKEVNRRELLLSGWLKQIQSILDYKIPQDVIVIIQFLDENISNDMKDMLSLYNRPPSIICSFHRDFVPDIKDLRAYMTKFGKVMNKIQMEWNPQKVPFAKIEFEKSTSVDKVCDGGNRQQLVSRHQSINFRVYRSRKEFDDKNHKRRSKRAVKNNNYHHQQQNNEGGQRGQRDRNRGRRYRASGRRRRGRYYQNRENRNNDGGNVNNRRGNNHNTMFRNDIMINDGGMNHNYDGYINDQRAQLNINNNNVFNMYNNNHWSMNMNGTGNNMTNYGREDLMNNSRVNSSGYNNND